MLGRCNQYKKAQKHICRFQIAVQIFLHKEKRPVFSFTIKNLTTNYFYIASHPKQEKTRSHLVPSTDRKYKQCIQFTKKRMKNTTSIQFLKIITYRERVRSEEENSKRKVRKQAYTYRSTRVNIQNLFDQ